ncbi:alpha-E domain-containing protein [Pontibacter qinzhouensis]|uniref:Alpha-E domain-containing protein n=1 Tax=Pontibacter qinzhouensis TaxID=2603253 RepID=A0A5C8K9X8_9BACT|nr:alpha-E domain-containing protein [Pontibacter qinzhouensis]TXK47943.1 alpha-E domain-containing protein [Pontibacter qinzhouensis]
MLSRIGNSLFWMGRYIERAEHIARYTKVQYVSSLDAPLAQSKDFVLESILSMAGVYYKYFGLYPQLNEEDVINFVTLEETNPFSILSYISGIRENARGTRDCISLELWEAINQCYHRVNSYSAARLQSEGVFRIAKLVEESTSVIKGYIDNTLIRNEVWMLISLGIHLERAIQVSLILLTKIRDIDKIDKEKLGGPVENYQWTTMLKSAESFDMFKRYYAANPNRRNTLEFLIFNPAFPKSISFNLNYIHKSIRDIAFHEKKEAGSINFMAGKMANSFKYMTIEDTEGGLTEFLNKTLKDLYDLANVLEEKYLNF